MKTFTLDQFKAWGALGAAVRKPRKLSRRQAQAMVRAREAKKKGGK